MIISTMALIVLNERWGSLFIPGNGSTFENISQWDDCDDLAGYLFYGRLSGRYLWGTIFLWYGLKNDRMK